MLLAFFPVENDKNWERHTFDAMDDTEALKTLVTSEWVRFYDMSQSGTQTRFALGYGDFMEDYNDEELDGGFWVVVLPTMSDIDIQKCSQG